MTVGDRSLRAVEVARQNGMAFGRTIAALATVEVRSVVISEVAANIRRARVDAIAERVQGAIAAAVSAQRTQGLNELAGSAWAEGAQAGFDAAMIEAGILLKAKPPTHARH